MKRITINGRFLTVPLSGVQRTAYELTLTLDSLIGQGKIDTSNVSFNIVYSGNILNPIELKHISLKKRGVLKGNLWEQLELPIISAGTMLLSMCSISTLFKRRQVVIIHDASTFVNKQFFSRGFSRWYDFALPMLAKLSRKVVTVSEFSKTELLRYLNVKADKITVIYNASSHIHRFGQPEQEFVDKMESLKPYCLAVSNLAENKNFRRLSEAISQTDFKGYNMVIGGGSASALKGVPPDDRAIYLGYVSNEELRYLYKNASLFIFPSIYEGFGIPPLEAMEMGCPVIASNTSSIPEVLGKACHYFNPTDAGNMAAQIYNLLTNEKELATLKQLGPEKARSYSWEHSALQLTNLLLENYA